MASLTIRPATLFDSQRRTVTVDFVFDSILFTVLTVIVTNGWDVAYAYKVTGPTQNFSQTVNANSTLSFTVAISWTLNSDQSLQNGWSFQG